MTRGPVIALSHGGGPMPLLGDPVHAEIVRSLQTRLPELLHLGTDLSPRAIVLVTAHWSERQPTISTGSSPDLFYDYYGFPQEAYELKYNAPGSPDVALEVAKAMKEEGLSPRLDDQRGWDHGLFVPMMLINPAADIPIVQVSVLSSESPSEHFAMGRALSRLRDENVAIIGSGFASLHSTRIMRSALMSSPDFRSRNDAWSQTVSGAVQAADPEDRLNDFKSWRQWPSAYEMHPQGGAEHFMPLIVAAGAGGTGEAKSYTDDYRGINMFSYYWE